MHGNPKYSANFTHLDYANPDAPKGGTYKQAAIGTFYNLNPYAIKGKAAQGLNLVYDRLMQRVWDEPFTMYPLIAEKVDIPEDRSALTVYINPAAKFHDGSPITAEDVLFSFETLRESGRPNMRRIYKLADEAKIIDERTVYFHFGNGYDRETVMIFAMMPVLSKNWWAGKEFDSTLLEIPVLNGPYRIAEVDPGRRIVYERVPDYWAKDLPVNVGHYNADKIVYDYYRDDTVAFEAFKSGDLDFRRESDAGKWATAYDFPAIKSGDIVAEALPHGRPERVRSLIFNTRRPPFDDRSVREALGYVLDFNWINTNLYHGQYKRISSFFPNASLAASGKPGEAELALLTPWKDSLPADIFGPAWQPPHAKDQRAQRENLRKADTLLQDSGWIVKDGKRVHQDTGAPFKFEIMLDSPEDEKLALSFINGLKRLGIDANVRVLDTAAFRGRLNEYDFDMVLYHWTNSLSPGTEQMLYWSCESANQPARWNFPGICHPAVDSLAQGIANAKDYAALTAHAHALDRILTWGYYTIPLYYAGADYAAYRNFLRHPDKTPLYGMVLETWWINAKDH
ncbi:MAG: ABC transporter substrate-binding protein [Rhodospirillales bacterium]|nr:ABC transporter substrate-binding protein [Rhodospirillales bacterium]MCB9995223.1 ABC transporter substrate-binding protein [Rhodospirillales bacterium]